MIQYGKIFGGDYIDSTLLMLMMMMQSGKNHEKIVLEIQSYDGQRNELRFSSIDDLEIFLDTDFEITNIDAPPNQLTSIKRLLESQNIMEVDRNAFIKLNRRIQGSVKEQLPEVRREVPDANLYDFNLHEKDITRI